MPLGIDFWKDFGGFWMLKWSKVEVKMGSKIGVNFERRFFKKPCFSTFLRSNRSKLRTKINQKSIKKWNPKYNASEHRFLNDFVEFRDPSWGQVGGKLALRIFGTSIQNGLGVSTSLWGRSRRLQSGLGTENIDFYKSPGEEARPSRSQDFRSLMR